MAMEHSKELSAQHNEDDGSNALRWILLVLMFIFSTVLVTSYQSVSDSDLAGNKTAQTVQKQQLNASLIKS